MFSHTNPVSNVGGEYTQNIGVRYSLDNIVVDTTLRIRLGSYAANNNTAIYILDTGVLTVSMLGINGGVYEEYYAIRNEGICNTVGSITISKGSVYNVGTMYKRYTLGISSNSYIDNG